MPALKGEVANEVSRRGYKEAYILFVWFIPTENSLTAYFQLPLRGSILAQCKFDTISLP